MILGVVSQQLLGSSGPAPVTQEVLFRDSSELDIVESTSTTVTLPASVELGDMLLLWVMHRDVLTTIPSGWTLLFGPTEPFVGTSEQRHSVYYKVSDGTEGSTTLTTIQGSSARMSSHAQVFYNPTGDGVEVYASDGYGQEAEGITLAELTALTAGQMAVISTTNVFAASSSNTTTLTPPAGYTSTPSDTAVGKRLGCAYKQMDADEVISGEYEMTYSFGTENEESRTVISVLLTWPLPPIPLVDTNGDVFVDGSGVVVTV